jgi:hypothetical protein
MARSLSERLHTHEQQKARLAQAEARLKLDAQKQRTRRLVEAGTLAEKAGLFELDTNALYGALLSLRDGVADKAQVETWTALGSGALAVENNARDEGKEPVLLTFTAPLSKDATVTLRKAGFRYSKVMQHWEGLARFEDASTLATTHGGTVRRINAPVEAGTKPNGQPGKGMIAGDGDDDLLSRAKPG